ncbi:hypothetical protein ACERK3_18430 [Phycisphaerales bacterium AB-hyl4]|uniref:Uncharacterized protein n=1 Tax=Natronomicrosphaera hydrolytica TaxID=3242702 RepID=A0ABV4UBC6_9BACT
MSHIEILFPDARDSLSDPGTWPHVQQRLTRLPGVHAAQWVNGNGTVAGRLDLRCRPEHVSLAQLRDLLDGSIAPDGALHLRLPVQGMVSPRQEGQIETALAGLASVSAVKASFARSEVTLHADVGLTSLRSV